MKTLNQNSVICLLALILLANRLVAQEPVVKLHYFNANNLQYLLLESNLKKGKVLTPQENKTYQLYIDDTKNLVATMKTDDKGKAKAFIPPSLKNIWDASPQHTFIVKAGNEDIISDFVITKSKVTLDTTTVDGVKNITVAVFKYEKDKWVPAADVELKVGIQRLGGLLPAGDEETYTTDSSGTVTAEFKKDKLPGNQKGEFVLAAKVDENEFFGNLLTEKKVVWGTPTQINTTFFDQRTLWSTRFRTPYWLLFMAYSITIGVWGTLFYLVRELVKIIKLGK